MALVALGTALHERGYVFVTPTPDTHRRVLARRAHAQAALTGESALRDIFGWTCRFRPELLPTSLLTLCQAANIVTPADEAGSVSSRVRFSTLDGPLGHRHLFVHSAYPTADRDAVFFGPDSYRFSAAVMRTVTAAGRLVDVGCGTGVGGLVLGARTNEVVLADVNLRALALAAVNVALAREIGVLDRATKVSLCESDVLDGVQGDIDVVISNPPYLVDTSKDGGGRLYRDGGGSQGTDLAVRIAASALKRLARGRGGQLVLYTGVPIVAGRNVLQDRLEPLLRGGAARWTWEELDPDVFGEELDGEAYLDTERLAAVVLMAEVR